jgi:large subunit ribosomal protein L14e
MIHGALWVIGYLQALVDAPGQTRRVVNFKRLALTDFKLELNRLAPKKTVVAKFAEAGEYGGRCTPLIC